MQIPLLGGAYVLLYYWRLVTLLLETLGFVHSLCSVQPVTSVSMEN